ncbi:MAG TPA: RsmG family class I SAM-dependent methyltransferase [Vicinamibacterales bacterium]|nr:RsmG family class I SAM-dependent methyltransferase [Vicinamibacterales bacterium]
MSLASLIAARAEAAGLSPTADVVRDCSLYVELLAKWNRKTNLTSLDVAPASAAAIDRLIVEALIAAQELTPDDRLVVDLGSGGGSPAIPLAIAARHVRLTMVEAREKKAAFLREATRVIALNAAVVVGRVEDLAVRDVQVMTARAIKLNDQIESVIESTLASPGRFFWFGSATSSVQDRVPAGLRDPREVSLPGGLLTISHKR